MKLLKTERGVVVNVYVKPDSRDFKIEVEDNELVICCRAAPVKGKINRELVKELSRLFKKRTEIVAGFASKQKKILIMDISLEEANDTLSKCKHV